MIKKSKEERELEKEVGELGKKKEELKVKTFKLKKMQYSRRLKKVLRKIMGFSPEYEDEDDLRFCTIDEFNALLDQLVEIVFVLFPNLEMSVQYVDCGVHLKRYCTELGQCLERSVSRMAIFEDEKSDQDMSRRSEEKYELLLKRQLPVEELRRIVFVAVILNAATSVLPVKRSSENFIDSIH